MSRFVVDASVALGWCFEDEPAPYAELVLKLLPSYKVVVPTHWFLEISNALLMAEKRKRTTTADTARAIALLDGLPIEIDTRTSEKAMVTTLSLARTHQLTAYDAAYLELCLREGLALATLDRQLVAACATTGVSMFNPVQTA